MTASGTKGQEYTLGTLRSLSEIEALAGEWRDLWLEHGSSNPFTHPAWIIAWLKHLGGAVSPLIVTVRKGQALVGVAPLGTCRFGLWRRLILLGSPMADYPDLLIHSGNPTVVGQITTYLDNQHWNWIDFVDISARNKNMDLLQQSFIKNGYSPNKQQGSICPGVTITGDWDGYWSQKKSKTRYTINKKEKRMEDENGSIDLEVLSAVDSICGGLDEASRVHAARWARQHTRTVFSEARGRAFFREALTGLAQDGLAKLYLLRAGNSLTAFSLSFIGDGVHYYYIPGFDQNFAKDSPGHLLLRELIREAHEMELGLFDFMRGDEEYKYRWANTHDYTMRLLVSKQDLWSKTGFAIRKSFFASRDWARTNPLARKVYFGLMNPLARMKKSFGG